MIKNKFYLFALLFFSTQSIFGQATKADPIDIQGWFGANLEADLPQKWSFDFSYQTRLNNNLTKNNGSYYSFGTKKRLFKPLSLLGEYRLSKVLNGTYNRFTAGVDIDYNIKKIKTDFRLLYQNQIQDFDDLRKENDDDHFLRARIRGRFPLAKNTSILLSMEPIYNIASGITIDNYRHQVGLRYNFKKYLRAEVFYINRSDYAKKYRRQYHIFGATITYSFKIKSK